VMVFRMQGNEASCAPKLHALKPDATYVLTDPYSGVHVTMTGQKLLHDGLPVTIEQNTARLLHYQLA
jgi:hypothetical protein